MILNNEELTTFENRTQAGANLGKELLGRKFVRPLILAMPRGGVPVGYEIAKILNAPLDIIVSRKIGHPQNPEYALGAIASPDIVIFDEEAMRDSGVAHRDLEKTIEKEWQEMERRTKLYRIRNKNQFSPETIIVADDGLATGLSAQAALASAQTVYKPKKLVFASPVCASQSLQSLQDSDAEVVCLKSTPNLMAIGSWYREFNQVSDEEVIGYLNKAKGGFSSGP